MIRNFGYHLIEENDSLLLAISGGIDSMVLLHMINELKEKLCLNLYIAHVDHQKRVSSIDDRDFVMKTAEDMNIPCFVETLNDDIEGNFHDYAHNLRYEFFYSLAKKHNINKIVLAHNANDNAETVLMRLARGSSFEGYRGILEKLYYRDILIIRPLLNVSRNDINVYQQVNLVAYKEDPTNDMDGYTRNRFRHHILPLLEKENPKYLEKISQFSLYQQWGYEIVDDISEKLLEKVEFGKSVSISIDMIKTQRKIIQIEVIKKTVNRLTNNAVELTFQNLLDILSLMESEKPQLEFSIENKIYVYKVYDKLEIKKQADRIDDFSFKINDFSKIRLYNGYLLNITKKPDKNYGFIYKLCYNNLDLVFPLTVRNRLNGDRVITESGTKKLKDIFIDKKMAMTERNSLPIIVDKNGEIIYVPGIFKKPSEGEQELYISIWKE
jgi:tRNA(Ile)-lysidine synthetase-like protein